LELRFQVEQPADCKCDAGLLQRHYLNWLAPLGGVLKKGNLMLVA